MRLLSRRLQVALLLMSGLLLASLVLQQQWILRPGAIASHPYFNYNVSREEPVDPSQSCILPKVHPFHPSIWNYLVEPRPIHCRARHPSFTFIDNWGYLRFNRSALSAAGYDPDSLRCTYQPVLRRNASDDDVTFGSETPVDPSGTPIKFEIIRVSCSNFAGFSVYNTLHAHVRNLSTAHSQPKEQRQVYNVVIFGLDSMSRLSFIRLLPHTYRYLTETMHAFVFRGMNKVGDNSFPNLVALLTGRKAYGPELPSGDENFDDWPIIWKKFSDAGYATLWAEDLVDFGLFNYLAKGFKKPPTDHYFRPFWLAVRDSSLLRTSSHLCFGSRPKHLFQMDYLRQFVHKYNASRTPYFGFSFLAELSHDYLAQVGAADQDFLELFRFLTEGNYLAKTVLLVVSDHGHRFDSIRETQIGRIEERMPFFAMYLPPSLRTEQPHVATNLKTNTVRLVSHYDIHATLSDLLQHVTSSQELGARETAEHAGGRTLFSAIPSERTCPEAGIPSHYCICEQEAPLSVDDARVVAAAEALITKINAMLEEGGVGQKCAKLFISQIKSAQLLIPGYGAYESVRSTVSSVPLETPLHPSAGQKIRVIVEANPSKAVLEATFHVSGGTQLDTEVIGDISRINKYGNQSACIRHPILRKYCFCQ